MSYDFSKLRGRVIEKFGTLGSFSSAMGWSERTNGLKINGNVEWRQSEIIKAGNLLDIEPRDYEKYFFNVKVQDIEQ